MFTIVCNSKEDQFKEKIKFKELTFCFRINLEYFRLLGTYSYILDLMDGGGWENGKEVGYLVSKDVWDTLTIFEYLESFKDI